MKFELAVADHQVAELRQMLQTCQGSSSGGGPVPGRKLQDLQGTGSMQVKNRELCMGDMAYTCCWMRLCLAMRRRAAPAHAP